MEISRLLDIAHKYRLSSNFGLSNFSNERLIHPSASSLPLNFNVFISNLFSDLMWPVNNFTSHGEHVPSQLHPTLPQPSGRVLSLNETHTFNASEQANVNFSSVLEMFSTLRPLDQLLANDRTLSHFGRYNDPRTPGDEGWLVTLAYHLIWWPMVLVAAAGNFLVIWIISTKPLMRTVMNRYLLNLTLSDFLSVTCNASFNFYFMLQENWPFGKFYCILNNFIANLTIASSVWTLMLISLDRYYAIVHPLRPRQSHRRLLVSIGAIWIFSALFSLPTLLYSDTLILNDEPKTGSHHTTNSVENLLLGILTPENANLNNLTTTEDFYGRLQTDDPVQTPVERRTLCILRWPDGLTGFSTYEFIYNLAFLILFYVIPLGTMMVALIVMSRVLWPREKIGETTTLSQHALIRSKRKVVCMLICVITVFGVCWLPYHTYFLSIYLWPSLIQTLGIKHIFLAFYWFAMANSLFNPIILFAMNRRIRNYIIYYLKFTCCLFGVHKRFAHVRASRRSSMQIMQFIKKGASELPCEKAVDSVQRGPATASASIRYEPNKHGPCKHKRCTYANSATNSDDESSGRPRTSSVGAKRHLKARYLHQPEYSSSSVNSANTQSNHSYSTNKRFLLRKSPDKTFDFEDSSQWNHSCPPILCNPRELNSGSSCSFCRDSNRHANCNGNCRCGSESTPTARAIINASSSTYNSQSCANLDRLYSITQSDVARMPKPPTKFSSRFRFFTWRSRRGVQCPMDSECGALSLTNRRPQHGANLNHIDRINTAL